MFPDVGVAVAVVLEVEAAEPRMDVGATSGLEAIDVCMNVMCSSMWKIRLRLR
jgi:hypothetical protein